jgi:regulator of sirC expression with transglutaminase-like and TPR domain
LTKKIREAMRRNERLGRLLIRRLYEGKGDTLVGLLEKKIHSLTEEREEVEKLLGYLRHNQEGFYGSQGLEGDTVECICGLRL